jgi:hypothetical protein
VADKLVFSTDFKDREITPTGKNKDGQPCFRSRFDWGRYQHGNDELAAYLDASTDPVDPHPIVDGVRQLRCGVLPKPLYEVASDPSKSRALSYFGSMITTQGLFGFKYGTVELVAAVRPEKGIIPAFWMMPTNGKMFPEYDAYEFFGDSPLHNNLHVQGPNGEWDRVQVPIQTSWKSDGQKHTFTIVWTAEYIVFKVDGVAVAERRISRNQRVPDTEMYIILNTAVGMSWDEKTKYGPTWDNATGWHNDTSLYSLKVWQKA